MQLAIRHPSPQQADFSKCVTPAFAAERLQMDEGSVQRLCRDELFKSGMAFQAIGPDGGAPQWFIDRSWKAALFDADAVGRDALPGLLDCTYKQRQRAYSRWNCIMRFRAALCGGGLLDDGLPPLIAKMQADFPDLKISRSTLYAWHKKCKFACRVAVLVDGRGGGTPSADPGVWSFFADFYLHENQPSIRQAWKAARRFAAENNLQWCSYSTCQSTLDQHIPPEKQARLRTPARYRQSLSPYIKQEPESWPAGKLWIGDHHQLNLICRWGKSIIRPWITVWMDWRTRKICGWVLTDNPNSSTVLGALRHGLMDKSNFGGPSDIWIDNGKDFSAWMFHGQTKAQRRQKIDPNVKPGPVAGLLLLMQITAHFAREYNPNGKARLERWFRTLENFYRLFDTFTGDGPDTKPERLAEILKTPHRIPSFSEVQRRLTDHIAGYNLNPDHQIEDLAENGVTLSPAEALEKWCDTKREFTDKNALDPNTQTASFDTPPLDLGINSTPGIPMMSAIAVDVSAVKTSAGNETYSLTFQHSDDGSTWVACGAALLITAPGVYPIYGALKKRYVRLDGVLGGTSPSITFVGIWLDTKPAAR
jgi:transposase InsO family protein